MEASESPSQLPVKVTAKPMARPSVWSERYGQKHKMARVTLPADMQPLKKVRLYRRGERRWTCQWWERREKKNLSHSLEGDIIDAISAAREIDQRLVATRASGRVGGKVTHELLLERRRQELHRRADADGLEVSTVRRYRSPLDYYERFVQQPLVARRYPHPLSTDRDRGFVHELMTFVKRNPMRGEPADPQYVCDVVRGMYAWAQDPDGGNLLPDYFRSPFSGKGSSARKIAPDVLGEPDITLNMAVDLVGACDLYQLRLFAPMALLGLRPSELCFLFHDYVNHEWLRVPCNPDIGYRSKGKRHKRFPLFEPLTTLLKRTATRSGPLYLRRAVVEGREEPSLLGIPLERFAQHYAVRSMRASGAAQRRDVRDQLLIEAGGVDYDRIEGEFQVLSRKLKWPTAATMKDLRHLFATSLANAGMPEHYRQYLMGQAPTSAPIGRYTHLNELPAQFLNAARQAFAPLTDAINNRLAEIAAASRAA
jgi:integrase